MKKEAETEYCIEYQHDGGTWSFPLFAVDDADAVAKIESIKRSLRLLGPLADRIPCPPSVAISMVAARDAVDRWRSGGRPQSRD